MFAWSIALAVVLTPLAVLSWFGAVIVRFMVTTFLADPTVTFEFAQSPDERPVPENYVVESHRFRSADGAELVGTLVRDRAIRGPGAPADGGHPPRGIVIFCPEYGGDLSTWRRYAWFVPEAGFWLFAFDFRGTGESPPCEGYVPRKWASDREVADLEAAVRYVQGLAGGPEHRVCLFGISRGGMTSLAVAGASPSVLGVVLEGAGSTLDVIFTYARKWSKVYAPEWICDAIPDLFFRIVAFLVLRISERKVGYGFPVLERLPSPRSGGSCLFIYGERDRHVDPSMARRAFDAFPGAKTLWMVPDARHNGAVLKCPDEYRERVIAHLVHLTGTGSWTIDVEPCLVRTPASCA